MRRRRYGDAADIDSVEAHLDEPALATPLALFDVYQGEAFKAGPAEFDRVDRALGWLSVVGESPERSRAAGELRDDLHRRGSPLAPRDAFIAGAAFGLDERLAVADSDFDVEGLSELLDVEFL